MTDLLAEDDVLAAIAGLTRDRLAALVAGEVIVPLQAKAGPVFRRIDLARLRLLCELSDDLELDDEAAVIVISLIDQLHEARFALRTLARLFADMPEDMRLRMAALPAGGASGC